MYPNTAGYKSEGTSKEAALSIDASTLRAKALSILESSQGLTADEVADRLGVSILSIRPRITELKRLGKIEETGMRRKNMSGKSAMVYRGKTGGQLEMFAFNRTAIL